MSDIQQVVPGPQEAAGRFRAYGARHLDMLAQRAGLSDDDRLAIRAVAAVLPFRTNSYVVDELIYWDAVPDDPIYRLVVPQPDMLPRADVDRMAGLLSLNASERQIRAAAAGTRSVAGRAAVLRPVRPPGNLAHRP